jgi:hypothetical protein
VEVEQSFRLGLSQREIHRVLRQAAIALGLPDAVLVTGHALLRYIPKDAEQPISPARVQDLSAAAILARSAAISGGSRPTAWWPTELPAVDAA